MTKRIPIIFAACLAAAACKGEKMQGPGPLEKGIGQEMGKYGPWVSGYVDTDYTDGIAAPVQLRRSGKSVTQLVRDSGFGEYPLKAKAAFFKPLNLIVFFEHGENSFSHELGHAIVNSEGGRLKVLLPNYSGPSAEEIERVVGARAEKAEGIGLAALLDSLLSETREGLGTVVEIAKDAAQLGANAMMLKMHPGGQNATAMIMEMQAVGGELADFSGKVEDYTRSMQGLLDAVKEAAEMDAADDEMCPGTSILERLERQRAEMHSALEELRAGGAVMERIREIDRKVRQAFPEDYREAELDHTKVDFALGAASAVINLTKDAFVSPKEVWARMVHSLMSLHVGEDCTNAYRLTEEELAVFEGMKYRGEGMFTDAVSKYRLALRMLADGVAPEEIRRALEFATEYEYNGEKFAWTPNEVHIIGRIPDIERLGE